VRDTALVIGQSAVVATAAWRFLVEEVFTITGRGTGVTGTLEGELPSAPLSGWIGADGERAAVDCITVELLRRDGDEQIALLLHGVEHDAVPPGSVIYSASTSA